MKKCVSIFMIACMLFTGLAIIPGTQAKTKVCKKNGFYKFMEDPDVSISKKYITFKDNDNTYMTYGKKKFKDFKYDGTDKLMTKDHKL